MSGPRSSWNAASSAYQAAHGQRLRETALAWGVWRIPEAQLRVLGDLRGRDVLELGCGAAQWSTALAREGVRVVGIDLSERQLAHARALSSALAVVPSLVHGNAEQLPFRSQSFDVVFCDHGATSFARPELAVAEASRVLRPGGSFAFCMSTPFRDACWDPETDRVEARLARSYFELAAIDDGESVTYQLPYGAWIRLFARHALIVEDLVELRAPDRAQTTYADYVSPAWARSWPAEHIWKLRKRSC